MTVLVKCPTCNGSKKVKGKLCPVCLGEAEIPRATAEDLRLESLRLVAEISNT